MIFLPVAAAAVDDDDVVVVVVVQNGEADLVSQCMPVQGSLRAGICDIRRPVCSVAPSGRLLATITLLCVHGRAVTRRVGRICYTPTWTISCARIL